MHVHAIKRVEYYLPGWRIVWGKDHRTWQLFHSWATFARLRNSADQSWKSNIHALMYFLHFCIAHLWHTHFTLTVVNVLFTLLYPSKDYRLYSIYRIDQRVQWLLYICAVDISHHHSGKKSRRAETAKMKISIFDSLKKTTSPIVCGQQIRYVTADHQAQSKTEKIAWISELVQESWGLKKLWSSMAIPYIWHQIGIVLVAKRECKSEGYLQTRIYTFDDLQVQVYISPAGGQYSDHLSKSAARFPFTILMSH